MVRLSESSEHMAFGFTVVGSRLFSRVKSPRCWNKVGTRCSAAVGTLGHLGLHKVHLQRVSKISPFPRSSNRLAAAPYSWLGPAGEAVKTVRFCRTVAALCQHCKSRRVAFDLRNDLDVLLARAGKLLLFACSTAVCKYKNLPSIDDRPSFAASDREFVSITEFSFTQRLRICI